MKKQNEHKLQSRCVRWLRLQYPYLRPVFFAVPNGGYRTASTAAMMKAEGVNRGVSDLILDVPTIRHHGLRIEMKDGSPQSPEQKIYQQAVQHCGYRYEVVHSMEQFMNLIDEHMLLVDKNIIARLVTLQATIEQAEIDKAKKELQKLTRT